MKLVWLKIIIVATAWPQLSFFYNKLKSNCWFIQIVFYIKACFIFMAEIIQLEW